MGGHCITIFGKKTWKKKRPTGNRVRRLEDNIKICVIERVWEDVVWIHLAQERDQWRALVRTVMNFRIPYFAGNYMRTCAVIVFQRITLLHGDN
jgi:hypothetical protein